MPPALHPRSRMTTSLFTTTLAFSFFVVAAPHFLPCPVDHRALADSADPDALSTDPTKRRRRKVRVAAEGEANTVSSNAVQKSPVEDMEWAKPKRECPVPKPTGLIAQALGFKGPNEDEK
jgi:cytochrome c oxidase assembly factor 2